MIADIVTVFMNSARKNSAKRIEVYSVWKPPTSSCSASTRSNGGRLSSAVPAIRKITNGTTPVTMRFQRGTDPAEARRRPGSSRCRGSTASRRAARRRPPTGRGPPRRTPSAPTPAPSRAAGTSSRTTSRPASRRTRRSTSRRGSSSTPMGGSASWRYVSWPKISTVALLLLGELAADRDDREHEEGRDQRQERGQDEHALVGPVGQQVLLEEELDAVGERLEDAERARPGWGRAGSTCRRGPCARTRS